MDNVIEVRRGGGKAAAAVASMASSEVIAVAEHTAPKWSWSSHDLQIDAERVS